MTASHHSINRRLLSLLVLPAFTLVACGGSGSARRMPATTLGPALTASTPASTSSSVALPTATSAPPTTAVRATAPATPSTPLSTAATSSTSPTPKARPWFAALRADGTLEAWAKDGKRLSVGTCATSLDYEAECRLGDVAMSSRALWYIVHNRATGSTLYRAALAGGEPVVMQATDLDESFQGLTVSPDDSYGWFTHTYPGDSLAPTLQYWQANGGVIAPAQATTAIAIALSPDGKRLAYSQFTVDGATGPTSKSRLVISELAMGGERRYDIEVNPNAPDVIDHLAWSPDGRHLLFNRSYEGSTVHVLDVATARSIEDATTPLAPSPALADGRPWAVEQACWTSASTLALGTWDTPYGEGKLSAGDVVAYDLGSGRRTPAGVQVFGQSGARWPAGGNGMACRDDGAVAVVDSVANAPADLKVIRPDGTTTRLGRDYLFVVQV